MARLLSVEDGLYTLRRQRATDAGWADDANTPEIKAREVNGWSIMPAGTLRVEVFKANKLWHFFMPMPPQGEEFQHLQRDSNGQLRWDWTRAFFEV